MKLLQIANKAPFPANDGSSIAIYNLATGFLANNVDLHFRCLNTLKHFKPDENVPNDFKLKANYTSFAINTTPTIFGAVFNLFSSKSYFVSRFFNRTFLNDLKNYIKAHNFDVIVLDGLFMCVYLNEIKKVSNAKTVLRAHNIEHYIWERHITNEKNKLKKLYLKIQNKRLKKFELNCLNAIDAILPITNFDKVAFKELGFKKPQFTTITGVNSNDYDLTPNNKFIQKSIFYFASMDWIPNQEAVDWFLNKCWHKITEKEPDCNFIIAGRNMPERFKKLNLPNVVVIENVEDKKAFYETYNIMLVPLLSGSGLRIKIIEGMSFGKAIVSTSIGAEGINYDDNKNIIIKNHSDLFADGVLELLSNAELSKNISVNAKEFAKQNFENNIILKNTTQFLTNLLAHD
ncbi:MAG: glycosyltransferase family 4 protein [Bacteroidetes bacterium]|nr:glycosyltransferase family 4 protein [Bacteroidota bacterium]